MTTKYRIHVILIQVNDDSETDIVREEEPAGYREDFESLEAANKVFDVLTGVAS